MKSTIVILMTVFSLEVGAQSFFHYEVYEQAPGMPGAFYNPDELFSSGILGEANDALAQNTRIGLPNYNLFTQPSPPLLTTNPADLEICTGNGTRLTASSNNTIYWYTTPPPLGSPVGTGTSYITPVLTTGYYTYYAVADNNGTKSDITAMEVVMVYPTPTLNILSTVNTLCTNETATLTVSGTTSYEWENGQLSPQLVIKPATTQTYKVTGINTAGCRSTAYYTQSVEACPALGGEDAIMTRESARQQITEALQDENKLFSVFPNPNNGEFNIRVSFISESTRVEVYNSLGQLTYNHKVTSEISSVAILDYPDGIYIVRIIENDKVLKQQKVVKE